MSRIDVVPAEKSRFKVLVNFVQRGVAYSSLAMANNAASAIHRAAPHMSLHLAANISSEQSKQTK